MLASLEVVVLEGDGGPGSPDVDPVLLAFEDGEPESLDLGTLQVGLAWTYQDELVVNHSRASHVD